MNRTRIYAVVLKYWFDMKRDLFRLFDIFWWPVFDLFIWGLLSLYLMKASASSINFVSLFLGGMILWTFFDRASRDISRSMMDELWNRNLVNLFSTPLGITEYLVGTLIIAVMKLIISAIVMIILATVFYGFRPLSIGWFFIPAIFGLTIFGWSISFFVQSMILRRGHTIEVFIWAVAILVQPFSCVFYPLKTLPVWAQSIATLLPTTYIFENMRSMLTTGTFDTGQVVFSFFLNVVYLVASIFFFYRTFVYAKIHGLLVRYY